MYQTQTDAVKALGVSRAWLFWRKDDPLYSPALQLPAPRYHPEQIRLWLAVAAGNQTQADASAEWAMIRSQIGQRPLVIERRVRA